jgi:HipA-like protein
MKEADNMRECKVYIEINGSQTPVGKIKGNDHSDAVFAYNDEYLSAGDSEPISISLPLQKGSFTPDQTRNFFESLLIPYIFEIFQKNFFR